MRAWPDLESAIQGGGPIDVVDVFRRPEHVAAIVDDCIRLKVPALWLQEGVIDEAAAQKARDAGIFTVMNRCMFRDRSMLATGLTLADHGSGTSVTGPEQACRLDLPRGGIERPVLHVDEVDLPHELPGTLRTSRSRIRFARQVRHFDLEHVAAGSRVIEAQA